MNKKYYGGTIFYDPATKVLKVYFTILSKNRFECFMGEYGINVKKRTDNGIFTKTKFIKEEKWYQDLNQEYNKALFQGKTLL